MHAIASARKFLDSCNVSWRSCSETERGYAAFVANLSYIVEEHHRLSASEAAHTRKLGAKISRTQDLSWGLV